MLSTKHFIRALIYFLCLLVTGCISVGGDTTERTFIQDHPGVAIIKSVTESEPRKLDFTWQAENFTGAPELISGVAIEQVEGMKIDAQVFVGQKLNLIRQLTVFQKGVTSPVILDQQWLINPYPDWRPE